MTHLLMPFHQVLAFHHFAPGTFSRIKRKEKCPRRSVLIILYKYGLFLGYRCVWIPKNGDYSPLFAPLFKLKHTPVPLNVFNLL